MEGRMEDEEFVVYNNNESNIFIEKNVLHIRPTLMPDETVQYGAIDLKRCTGKYESNECSMNAAGFNILPPIKTAQISTKHFNFKYGKIEVRAKLPVGDWIVPQIWLQPKNKEYGPLFNSGRINIVSYIGNEVLRKSDGDDISKAVHSGFLMGAGKHIKEEHSPPRRGEFWSSGFNTYTLIWKPDSILGYSRNYYQVEVSVGENQTLARLMNFTPDEIKSTWGDGGPLAPFDAEFYITLGVTVGGHDNIFPESSVGASNHAKPWKSSDIKRSLNFWHDRANWHRTWRKGDSDLQIDYIKVTALPL